MEGHNITDAGPYVFVAQVESEFSERSNETFRTLIIFT